MYSTINNRLNVNKLITNLHVYIFESHELYAWNVFIHDKIILIHSIFENFLIHWT